MTNYSVTRQIGIDAGHRLSTHGSKCRHFHGHRYEIKATCESVSGDLVDAGEETGMIIDFGFLKEEMMQIIDATCDHGMILCVDDVAALRMFCPMGDDFEAWHAAISADVRANRYSMPDAVALGSKLYVMGSEPTAENLARHWFNRLKPAIGERSNGLAKLTRIIVMETPNCTAEYFEQ